MKSIAVSLALVFTIVIAFGLLSLFIPHQTNKLATNQHAIVFSPSYNHSQAFKKLMSAGASPVRSALFDFIIIAEGDENTISQTVQLDGVLFSFNPRVLGSCLTRTTLPFYQAKES